MRPGETKTQKILAAEKPEECGMRGARGVRRCSGRRAYGRNDRSADVEVDRGTEEGGKRASKRLNQKLRARNVR